MPEEENQLGSVIHSPKGEVGKETNKISSFKPLHASEILIQEEVPISWLWENMIPEGGFCTLAGYMKKGKTELAYGLIQAMSQGNNYLGFETKQSNILILALEEHSRDVRKRLQRLGVEPEDNIYIQYPPYTLTKEAIKELRDFISQQDIDLVLIDTLSRFWRVQDENNNAEVGRVLNPLLDLSRELDVAMLFIHHQNKSGGEGGRGIRGASAILGLVDQAITLDGRQGGPDTNRVLSTIGRYVDSPKELLIDYVDGRYVLLGKPEEFDKEAIKNKVLEVITKEPMSIDEVKETTGLSDKKVRTSLKALYREEKIVEEGQGRKGSPRLYSIHSQPTSKGQETNIL